jgi:hypothetical protein
MRWAGHVVGIGEIKAYIILVRKLEGKCHLEVLVVDGRIILK